MPRPQTKKSRRPVGPTGPAAEYEIEALSGIEHVALEELATVPGVRDVREGRFWFPGDPARLTRLRGSVAVYRIKTFDVPRPKALLGHQQLGDLAAFLRPVIAYGGHQSFRLSAAGRESATMRRLAEELESLLGVPHHPEEGELLIRLRPTENPNRIIEKLPPERFAASRGPRTAASGRFPRRDGRQEWNVPDDEAEPEVEPEQRFETGWDVLARLTPRPLSARPWRVCNMAGGLNATIAFAVFKLAGVREQDRIFNPMSGSGTLLIERDLLGPSAALVGVDTDPDAVRCAQQNIEAAKRQIEVAQVDALETGLPPRSFDLIVADLPWGDAITVRGGNEALYTAFLKEMHRLCSRQGRLVVLTHELKLFERLLTEQDRWHAHELFQVYSGGHHPKAYLLSKS
ncbi:methyltransferase domain-containing protein [Deinococcus irradiatisoli]|uniref:methyltransferase domain-containing protein n=1 Tax=Deinococcus irradiatisoli TaxID=2202254 RepID=UPI001FEA4C63|nr:methyltransferase domain-containing protein [Deinococcus irradiatisoli]